MDTRSGRDRLAPPGSRSRATVSTKLTPTTSAVIPERLLDGFPSLIPDESCGHWWRIHWDDLGPWFFASDDGSRAESKVGRFDLPLPLGTCYVTEQPLPGLAEHLRTPDVSAREAQESANLRAMTAMPLNPWFGKPLADFASPSVSEHGGPPDVALLSRAEGRRWALAAREAGYYGIRYRLGQDPCRRIGLALFCKYGERDLPFHSTVALPVRPRNELLALFGTYRGDDPQAA
jgi:hypothetical protein